SIYRVLPTGTDPPRCPYTPTLPVLPNGTDTGSKPVRIYCVMMHLFSRNGREPAHGIETKCIADDIITCSGRKERWLGREKGWGNMPKASWWHSPFACCKEMICNFCRYGL